MTPHDLFGVLVRISGFWIAIYGFSCLIAGIAVAYSGNPKDESDKTAATSCGTFLVWGVVALMGGMLIMNTADSLVISCYGDVINKPASE